MPKCLLGRGETVRDAVVDRTLKARFARLERKYNARTRTTRGKFVTQQTTSSSVTTTCISPNHSVILDFHNEHTFAMDIKANIRRFLKRSKSGKQTYTKAKDSPNQPAVSPETIVRPPTAPTRPRTSPSPQRLRKQASSQYSHDKYLKQPTIIVHDESDGISFETLAEKDRRSSAEADGEQLHLKQQKSLSGLYHQPTLILQQPTPPPENHSATNRPAVFGDHESPSPR